MKNIMIKERKYTEHHTSLCRGYVSVKDGGKDAPVPYKGKFGEGYTVKSHNPNSTQYCYITYYVA